MALSIVSAFARGAAKPMFVKNISHHSGFFIGLHGGLQHISVNSKWTNLYSGIPVAFEKYSLTSNGAIIGGQLSIGHVTSNKFYVGFDIFSNYSTVNTTLDNQMMLQNVIKYKLKDSYGLAIKAGIVTGNDILLYSKIGGVLSKRTVSSVMRALPQHDPYENKVVTSKKYNPGMIAGFGIDVPINSKLSLGAEANFTKYKTDRTINPGYFMIEMRPETYNFLLKLTYKMY
jgi:hypothetical protein